MTNLSLSWIDPDAWAALLVGARLTERRERAVAPLLDTAPLAAAGVAPAAAPAAAAETLLPPAWQPPPGSLAERLDSLVRWVAEVTDASSIFVADEGGLPVFTPHEDSTYLWASADLLALLKRVRRLVDTPTEGGVSLSLEGGRRLHFVEATTGAGIFGLGLVCGGPLDEPRLEQLRSALRRAFKSD
jgi:hypothetical protein